MNRLDEATGKAAGPSHARWLYMEMLVRVRSCRFKSIKGGTPNENSF